MQPAQLRLFPDPQPLIERLGRRFFRELPDTPGVYFFRDARETVLYVGKAKNLRRRLGSYRVANPERLPRRILRLLHRAESIVWEETANEAAALVREAELLLELKPKFNRAGVWRPPERHVVWRETATGIELALLPEAIDGWTRVASVRARAPRFIQALARLAWCRMQPERGFLGLPCGWLDGPSGESLSVPGRPDLFLKLLEELTATDALTLEDALAQQAFAEDIEFLQRRIARTPSTIAR